MSKHQPPETVGPQSNGVYVLSDAETRDTRLVRCTRCSFVLVSCVLQLSALDWRDRLPDWQREAKQPILDRRTAQPVVFDLEWLDCEDLVASNDNMPPEGAEDPAVEAAVRTYDDNLRSYLDDTCRQPIGANSRPVVHDVNRQRFIEIATIVAAAFPKLAAFWPRHPIGRATPPMADNDNVARRWRHSR